MGDESFDITVIGGGIAGVGVARECALAGYKVLLLEKKNIGQATSANSLRIIHGGFRYLQSFNIPRVLESIRDQQYWLTHDPDLVQPLPCLMPLERFSMRSKFPLQGAAVLYRALRSSVGQKTFLPPPKIVSAHKAIELCDLLSRHVPHGALLWYDARLLDPMLFVQRRLKEIVNVGGEYRENIKAINLKVSSDTVSIKLSNDTDVRSKIVVNTLGPWFGSLHSDPPNSMNELHWCKAFNLVFNTDIKLEVAMSLQCDQKRLLFLVPREANKIALGTWYVPFQGTPDSMQVTAAEASELESCFTKEFGQALGSVDQTEAGILPMSHMKQGIPQLYGSERIISQNTRVIEVLSTKYTTFRAQGLKVLSMIQKIIGPKVQGRS